jgi:hypothetical protein
VRQHEHITQLYDAVGTVHMLGAVGLAVEMSEEGGGTAVPWQLPDGVGHLEALEFSDAMGKRLVDAAMNGQASWFDFLLLNVGKVAQSSDVVELHANLIWLAGTCVRWSLGINQRQNPHTQYEVTFWNDIQKLAEQQMHEWSRASLLLARFFPGLADPHCQTCGYRQSDISSYHCAKGR